MKKGIELSLNFLVTIIIALTIFGFGVKFIYNLASQATGLSDLTLDELDKQIEELLCDSTDRVCIGVDRKQINKGEFDVFGIKIINIQDSQNFDISVTPSAAFTKNNAPISISDMNKIIVMYRKETTIPRNGEDSIGVGVEVPKDIPSGTYIFDVRVISSDGSYDILRKIYVEVP